MKDPKFKPTADLERDGFGQTIPAQDKTKLRDKSHVSLMYIV